MRKVLRNSSLGVWGILACLLLFASCGEKRKADVLAPNKLESILYDYHLAQVMVSDLPTQERYKKELYFDYIYSKYGVTSAEIDSSLVYYARYPETLSQIYKNLSLRLERDLLRIENETQLQVVHTPIAVAGDSADIWYESRLQLLHPSVLTNRFSFTIPNDTNFKANDCFEWSGDVLFLHDELDSLNQYLQLAFTAEFANDSLLSVDTVLYTSSSYLLQLADTAGVNLRELHGNVYYKGKESEPGVIMYRPQLMRYRYVEPIDTLSSDSVHDSIDSVSEVDVEAVPAMTEVSSHK